MPSAPTSIADLVRDLYYSDDKHDDAIAQLKIIYGIKVTFLMEEDFISEYQFRVRGYIVEVDDLNPPANDFIDDERITTSRDRVANVLEDILSR